MSAAAAASAALESGRASLGVVDLVVAGRRSGSLPGQRPLPGVVHCVLAGRQLAQSALLVRASSSGHLVGAAVDALHALSMVLLAGASTQYRAAAVRQVLVAGPLAGLELLVGRSAST